MSTTYSESEKLLIKALGGGRTEIALLITYMRPEQLYEMFAMECWLEYREGPEVDV